MLWITCGQFTPAGAQVVPKLPNSEEWQKTFIYCKGFQDPVARRARRDFLTRELGRMAEVCDIYLARGLDMLPDAYYNRDEIVERE